jgi:hypothetical protein
VVKNLRAMIVVVFNLKATLTVLLGTDTKEMSHVAESWDERQVQVLCSYFWKSPSIGVFI